MRKKKNAFMRGLENNFLARSVARQYTRGSKLSSSKATERAFKRGMRKSKGSRATARAFLSAKGRR